MTYDDDNPHHHNIARMFGQILEVMVPNHEKECEALDLNNTPRRMASMMHELLWGYNHDEDWLTDQCTTFPIKEGEGDMVVETNIPFASVCSHHLLPFSGQASFGYIPEKKILGLSKPLRVIDYFAARLQVQERLTSQVTDFLHELLEPKAIIIVMSAEHQCVACRGVNKPGVITKTAALRPRTMEARIKDEFYRLMGM